MKDNNEQIKYDNINLIKAILNEGREKEFNLKPDKVFNVAYEFYKFYEVFQDELLINWAKDVSKNKELKSSYHAGHFPLYCFTAFATSYNNYKNKEDEVY